MKELTFSSRQDLSQKMSSVFHPVTRSEEADVSPTINIWKIKMNVSLLWSEQRAFII